MGVHVLDLDDLRWHSYLSRVRHDIYHVPEFLATEDEFRGTVTRLLVVEENDDVLVVPIIFTAVANSVSDATSPWVHSSPLFSAHSTPEWRHDAIRQMIARLRELGVVSLFLRSHPLLDRDFLSFADFGAIVRHGPTYYIPLDRTLEEIRGDMRSNHRRNIRKAQAAGHVVELDSDWQYLSEFHRIYTQTMDRLDAQPPSRFPPEYFERIRDEVDSRASLWILKMDGELAGAHLVTECDGTVQYLLGATNADYYRQVPQVAIFDTVLQWAHDRGNLHYFLGGGIQESLRHFKAGFTKSQTDFMTARIIVNPAEYGRLCGAWESSSGQLTAGMDAYFPAYRQPVAELVVP